LPPVEGGAAIGIDAGGSGAAFRTRSISKRASGAKIALLPVSANSPRIASADRRLPLDAEDQKNKKYPLASLAFHDVSSSRAAGRCDCGAMIRSGAVAAS
jgi:hypothetical protein